MCGDPMQIVMLGTLSLSGGAGVAAMRRKLLAVAQRLGISASRGSRLAASASDYAKTATGHGALELRIGLTGAASEQEFLLETMALTADEAASGEEGIEMIRQAVVAGQPYEIAFIDWQMPKLDGIETCKRILALPDLPTAPHLVMVTAYGREEVLKQAEDTGIENVLVEPVTSSTLFDTTLSVLRADDELRDDVQSAPSLDMGRTRGTRVLLVEDNEINQEVAIGQLEDVEIRVDLADNGEIAVRMVQEKDYDLVLMDVQMPIMDGIEATRIIRSDPRFKTLPIVAMTANAMAVDRKRCLEAGMNDHIAKPIDPDELFKVLLRWARRRSVEGTMEQSLGSL
jgi:two-component system, sensor histidine kinase and response regulator